LRSPLDSTGGEAELPAWDLSDLFAGTDDPALAAALDQAAADSRAFQGKYAGTLAGASGDTLAEAIAGYERIEEVLGRIMSFGSLIFAGDALKPENGRFYQTLQERVTTISSDLLFFTLELNRLDDAVLEKKFSSRALVRWRPWLRDLRVFRPHQLADELEKLLHEKEVTGRSAWNRLFDETIATMTVPVSGALAGQCCSTASAIAAAALPAPTTSVRPRGGGGSCGGTICNGSAAFTAARKLPSRSSRGVIGVRPAAFRDSDRYSCR
jgi:oligoendopeptidase F